MNSQNMNSQEEKNALEALLQDEGTSSLVVAPKNGEIKPAPVVAATVPPTIPTNAFEVLVPTLIEGLTRAYGDYQISQLANLPTMTDQDLHRLRDIAAHVQRTQGMLEMLTTLQVSPVAPAVLVDTPDQDIPTRDLSVPLPTGPILDKFDIDTRAVRYVFPKMEELFDYGNVRHRNHLANWVVMTIAAATLKSMGGTTEWINTRLINSKAAESFFLFEEQRKDVFIDALDEKLTISEDCRTAIGYVLQSLRKADFVVNEGKNSPKWKLASHGIDFLNGLRAQLLR